ncbi:ATP synthase subunit alpha [Erysipelothrix larvae]|uniref:ATP synthase subunit alpha n=1 Tax=Erysipelothrix larvae TaxID=1514105 RepID=A0A0X8H0A5_9FIRM|nr:F0F1 ATP synthase subunit alpha [Erysipelothrix larvae]AMC93729.1 ATP synthase subunit alpha [Erysipelothrix larvae]
MDKRSEQIIETIKNRVEGLNWEVEDQDIGLVHSVGDGIAFVKGLKDVLSGELLKFDSGLMGLAMNLENDQVGVVLLGNDAEIREKDKVYRTKHVVDTPVGDALIGRVVNALGIAIDGLDDIEDKVFKPIEVQAPKVMARQSVKEPLLTGWKIIDAMIPIGKGQRELIIGDRQTGKTSIAMNAILNQKGLGLTCVYVAIGQKASTIARVVEQFRISGALEYTTVVASPADDMASLQYIAPYTGCTIAEHWMNQGKDVLIVYDDLSKHAVAYRTISLLLRRPSGREAFPGDVFYLHSRLLERSAKLNDKHGGGSMTALPIIETQAGDISAYIPTNVISITDGQLFLNLDAFNSGIRPAVDSGLSVSRVGSAAQTQAMKHVSSSLKLELANYQDLLSFAQFSTDVDESTRRVLEHGSRLTELLKQDVNKPLSQDLIILSLFMNKYGFLDRLEVFEILPYESFMHDEMKRKYDDLIQEIKLEYQLGPSLISKITDAMEDIYTLYRGMYYET